MSSENDEEQKYVPKFTSFRPKAPTQAEPPTKPRESRTKRHDHHESYRQHERSRVSAHHHERASSKALLRQSLPDHEKRRHHHEHDHRRGDEALRGIESRSRVSDPELYITDTKGDRYNVVYGSLHRYDVPHYHRAGRGRVLGVPLNYWIDRDSLDGKTMTLCTSAMLANDDLTRKRQNAAWKQARRATALYRIRQDRAVVANEEFKQDFISVVPERPHKRRRLASAKLADDSSSSASDEVDYRSIMGKPKTPLPAEVVLESDITADDDASGAAARLMNAELSKRVAENPNDVDAWLALIHHQEMLVGTTDSENNRVLTSSEKRSIADVRISMYERALSAILPTTPRDRLILGLLEEGAKLWDNKLLASKWRDYLQRYPGHMTLWVKYLNFQQTTFLDFTYEKSRDFIINCIELNRSSTRPDSSPQHTLEEKEIHLYLLLRLTLLMRESGFSEHAVALWQAILEFNIFRPKAFVPLHDERAAVASFSAFWDSEVARIGEAGAKGWDSSEGSAVDPRSDEEHDAIDSDSPFASWEVAEWKRMQASFLPARTLDETTEDDPYRIILSSDVEKLLADFTEPDMTDSLLDAFLLFCRLPPVFSQSVTVRQWGLDPFILNDYMDVRGDIRRDWFPPSLSSSAEITDGESVANKFPLPHMLATPETLFADDQWFSAFRSFQTLHSGAEGTCLSTNWILRAMRHLVSRLSNNAPLAEYSAALEYACNPKSAKAYVKRLLKQRPLCLRLYNAYALMELRDGEDASAERVLSTTLAMSARHDEVENMDGRTMLWVTWIWQMLKKGDLDKALRLLATFPNGCVDGETISRASQSVVSMSPAELLKCQQFYTEVTEHGLIQTREASFTNATECLALLTYLTQGRDLAKALGVYADREAQLSKQVVLNDISRFRERLHQSKAKLLHYHASSARLYKPALLREELANSISLFPSNTLFLDLFAWNERRFRIADRVRSVVKQQTSLHRQDRPSQGQPDSKLIPFLYAIYSESHRGMSAGSTTHSVRAAFESAVSSESPVRSSALIWKLYVLFECALSQGQKARDVLFRAIRACPWVKEFVMLAFREKVLRDAIAGMAVESIPGETNETMTAGGREQLRKVWNVLVEKDLRVHVDLEEWFEDQGLGADDGDAGDAPFKLPHDEDSMDEAL